MARSLWKGPFVDGYLLKKAEAARGVGPQRGHQDLEPSLHDPAAVRRPHLRGLQRPQAYPGLRERGNGRPQVRRILADADLPRSRGATKRRRGSKMGKTATPRALARQRGQSRRPQSARQPAEAEPCRPAHPGQKGRDRARRSRVLAQADRSRRAGSACKSAIANAENNHDLDVDDLMVARPSSARRWS